MPDHAQEVKQILELFNIDTTLDLKKKYISVILQGVWLRGKCEGIKELGKELNNA